MTPLRQEASQGASREQLIDRCVRAALKDFYGRRWKAGAKSLLEVNGSGFFLVAVQAMYREALA